MNTHIRSIDPHTDQRWHEDHPQRASQDQREHVEPTSGPVARIIAGSVASTGLALVVAATRHPARRSRGPAAVAGAVVLAAELGMNPSTVGRILARHQVPLLAAIDPITGKPVRSERRSEKGYEHREPGAMIHVDVKTLGPRSRPAAAGACTVGSNSLVVERLSLKLTFCSLVDQGASVSHTFTGRIGVLLSCRGDVRAPTGQRSDSRSQHARGLQKSIPGSLRRS